MTAISKIITLAARQIKDVAGNTWDHEDVLIPYINDGIAELLNLKPEENPVAVTLDLDEGPEQSIGSGKEIVSLLDASHNMITSTETESVSSGGIAAVISALGATWSAARDASTGTVGDPNVLIGAYNELD